MVVCTANELLEWKDFPNGLRILLLDEDTDSAAHIKSKLQDMDFIVTAFSSAQEALSAISSTDECFHVAIVEVNVNNRDGRCSLLEAAHDLPIIMISKEHCLSTMMKCIALGAVEFLIKPLSEEKLRNIWQHVVHKAFNTSINAKSESLKSVKEFVGSVLEIQQQNLVTKVEESEEPMIDTEMDQSDDHEQSAASDKFPAPSTPQIKQGERTLDDGDDQDHNGSPVKESVEFADGETKSVDNTNNNNNENSSAKMEVETPITAPVVAIKEEDCDDGSKDTDKSVPKLHDKEDNYSPSVGPNSGNSNKESTPNFCGARSSRKKMKVRTEGENRVKGVDWTPDLHKKFVQAVEQLGVDQAIPSRILELMKVEGLTRHNIASHLQKYRMHRRHILPKQEERRWPHPRDSTMHRNYYHHRPVMAYPSYHAGHSFASGQVYPMWGQQGCHPPGFPVWAPPSYSWQPPESWPWNPYHAVHADAWGCPVIPPPPCQSPGYHQVQNVYGFHNAESYGKNSSDIIPGEEVIDKVVKEAISKPWLPLPLGLKPPSTDSVLSELSKQGISTTHSHTHPC